MKVSIFDEPTLQFFAGTHIDVPFGISNYGPFDRGTKKSIKIAVAGTTQTIEGVLQWLDKCRTGIAAKATNRPNLFPAFPGFGDESCFGVNWTTEARHQRFIRADIIDGLVNITDENKRVEEAVGLFITELEYLANETDAEVLICAPPLKMFELIDPSTDEAAPREADDDDSSEKKGSPTRYVFHHLLKARAMALRKPIQLIRPHTYGGKVSRPKKEGGETKPVQDEATRAWNFHTALYYKANGVPWRMQRDTADFATCYIGISFYKSLDQQSLLSGLAQVFNQRGDGVVVRGGQARVSKEDRTVTLPPESAKKIIEDALKAYHDEHKHFPARVVVHKSSSFVPDEREAILAGVRGLNISLCDLISMRRTFTRLYRIGNYPPLRGTCLEPDDGRAVLYTRGSVDFFRAYPGMYVPRPLEIKFELAEQSRHMLIREVLALTKMNWNNTQFDGSKPITLRASEQVGDVLKYVPIDGYIHPRYSFYM